MRVIATTGILLWAACAGLAQDELASVPRKAQIEFRQGLRYEQNRQWQEAFAAFSGSTPIMVRKVEPSRVTS